MKRVSENPPQRFPDKPRQEKAIAFDFIKNNIEYYLPLIVKVTRRKDNNKPRKSILPLFPGYISFCADNFTAPKIYKTGRVVSVITVKNQKRFLEDLMQIYYALENGADLMPVNERYEEGDLVYISDGPFKGLKGTISKIHENNRLILSVNGLGKASMSININFVKPISKN